MPAAADTKPATPSESQQFLKAMQDQVALTKRLLQNVELVVKRDQDDPLAPPHMPVVNDAVASVNERLDLLRTINTNIITLGQMIEKNDRSLARNIAKGVFYGVLLATVIGGIFGFVIIRVAIVPAH